MIIDLVKKTRSYRRYDNSAVVSRKTLESFVDTSRLTAAAANKQPFKYFLCYEPKGAQTIFKNIKWAALLKDWGGPAENERPPAYIVLAADTTVMPSPNMIDAGIIAQTILLAATEAGLGGCLFASFSKETLKTDLNLAPNIDPVLVIAVGKPTEQVVLDQVKDGNTAYYRDEQNVHHVPKRCLADVLLN